MSEQVLIQFRADKALKQEVAEIQEQKAVKVLDAVFDGKITYLVKGTYC